MDGSRQSEQKGHGDPRYSILFEIDSIIFLDGNFRVILANSATEKTFGYLSSELIGNSIEHLFSLRIRKRFYRILKNIAELPDKRSQKPFGPIRMIRKDKTVLISEISVSVTGPEEDYQYHVIIRNISEKHRILMDLKRANESLRKMDREKEELLEKLEEKVRQRSRLLAGYYKGMKEELNLAKKLQTEILSDIPSVAGIQIHSMYLPMMEVGGDLYDLFQIRPGALRVFLADATGHGIQAALLTMTLKGILESIKKKDTDPGTILTEFNHEYCRNFGNIGMFFSCFLADIDTVSKKISYASGGHSTQFFLSKDLVLGLDRTGSLLGLDSNNRYGVFKFSYQYGDRLFLFTDGIYEEFNSDKQQFGELAVQNILAKKFSEPMEETIPAILQSLIEHLGSQKIQDDITAILLALNFPDL
ncbi:SpoIIE family protein phosphatase [Leptospira borgpetersenii serovar Hardjo-bovis]|uniref:Stage II sporulation protein E n=1 Tax=Leptospira borgpetersenii serovar Hardjo-bovis str. Sponselee TaxID=1303729 RepID=M6C425_LEPBO|nr:SpoIIE family protein phosphatase [Leptospira borgpetersenii]ABJ79333.1 Serine phosphatase sigma subunit regulator [Leptospira borgpetersenii serovar Hardjo-bovis str. L550]AMX58649.1 serine phosphatase [Leptospira borgpetersenii serovar Hardjo]AMX61904.1 serine phosphatase [Leptospira borgpetersenii serovar Hardjo]AMX65146.1 serine phosphatase [Leptospira borgpetersenii serovar Hardjo]AMX68357.1 serine phosphatase [Leptospira borgpetersenii serovar Hardjo]